MSSTASGLLGWLRERMSSTKQTAKPVAPSSTNPPGSLSLGLGVLSQLGSTNTVVSPAGVHVALRLAACGATKNSPTATELQAVLGRGDGGFAAAAKSDKLTVATAVYADNEVKAEFKNRAKNEFAAEVAPLPKSADPVNAWVKSATKGKVPSILDAVPEGTCAILLSAVHFAAPWATAFDVKETEPMEFAAASGKSTEARMMNTRNKKYAYTERLCGNHKVQVVALPYGGGDGFSGVVVLPAPDVSLDAVVGVLAGKSGAAEWSKLIGSMRDTELGYLGLPRFKLEWGGSLKQAMNNLGVKAAFVGSAFDEIAPETAISDIMHKATIECTEQGTVAAAATAVVMARSMATQKPEVICNRPFLFAVTAGDELLFVCRVDDVVDPE